jgi:hypothetical protein
MKSELLNSSASRLAHSQSLDVFGDRPFLPISGIFFFSCRACIPQHKRVVALRPLSQPHGASDGLVPALQFSGDCQAFGLNMRGCSL